MKSTVYSGFLVKW